LSSKSFERKTRKKTGVKKVGRQGSKKKKRIRGGIIFRVHDFLRFKAFYGKQQLGVHDVVGAGKNGWTETKGGTLC